MSQFNRSTTGALAPLLARAGSRQLQRSLRLSLPKHQPALAIFIQHSRFVSTESSTTNTSGGHGNFPPPGFNADQAKKPTNPPEQNRQSQEAAEAEAGPEHFVGPEGNDPVAAGDTTVPTGEPKTKASADASISELAAQKAEHEKKTTEKTSAVAKKEEKKLTLWQKVKKEAAHYRDGTKLLGTEIKISFKLAMKMAAGFELTRREHRQVSRRLCSLL